VERLSEMLEQLERMRAANMALIEDRKELARG
jgi:hypothetical protein